MAWLKWIWSIIPLAWWIRIGFIFITIISWLLLPGPPVPESYPVWLFGFQAITVAALAIFSLCLFLIRSKDVIEFVVVPLKEFKEYIHYVNGYMKEWWSKRPGRKQ